MAIVKRGSILKDRDCAIRQATANTTQGRPGTPTLESGLMPSREDTIMPRYTGGGVSDAPVSADRAEPTGER
ncbi:MAG: hypothetical protein WCB11_26255 [Terriglobales bacterium]